MTSTLQSTYFIGAGTTTFTAAFSELTPDPSAMSLTSDIAYPEPAIDAAVAADALLRMTGFGKNAQGVQRFFATALDPDGRLAIDCPASEGLSTPSLGRVPANAPPAAEGSAPQTAAPIRSADELLKRLFLTNLAENPATLEEFARKMGFNKKRVLILCRQFNISLPAAFHETTQKRHSPRRGDLLALSIVGHTLEEMRGPMGGLSRERIRQLLRKENLNEFRITRRRELQLAREEPGIKLRAERQAFVNALRLLEEVRKPESPWIEVQIWKYRIKHPDNRPGCISRKKLYKLFEAYALAWIKRKRLSVEKLGKITGISAQYVAKILRDAGLGSMYWNFDRHVTPKWKKEAIVRAFISSPLSAGDIARFLELPYHVVRENLKHRGYRRISRAPILKRGFGERYLTYRLASEVYEAQDLGLTPEETSYVLDLPLERVRYTQYRRHQFGPVIIRALRDMYPEEGINTPYRWKEKTN